MEDCSSGAEKMNNSFVVKNCKMVMLIPIMIKQLLADENILLFSFQKQIITSFITQKRLKNQKFLAEEASKMSLQHL